MRLQLRAANDAPRVSERSAALIAAALALPGILPSHAHAQTAPDEGVVALRYLDYRDWQPGARRMTVRSPTLYALIPLSQTLTLEGSATHDTMSGASPLFHNTLSGASGLGVTDYRIAGDAKLTKYFDGNALALGAAMFFGSLYALLRRRRGVPASVRSSAGPDETIDDEYLDHAPVGRTLLFAGIGFVVMVTALAAIIAF